MEGLRLRVVEVEERDPAMVVKPWQYPE